MKKKYTKIKGIRIAYKGILNWFERARILGMIEAGVVSGTLEYNGWWIIAKHDL